MLIAFPSSRIVAGCDEAGRGALAGDVFAAAVIFPKDYTNDDINDSKALTHEQRTELKCVIENDALAFSVAQVSVSEIDQTNILKCAIKAMHLSLEKLTLQPQLIIVDGHYFKPPYHSVPHKCIVKGDAIFLEIAAASILAKTYRDNYITSLHELQSMYYWKDNKGYPTLKHRKAIEQHGISQYHRKTFKLIK